MKVLSKEAEMAEKLMYALAQGGTMTPDAARVCDMAEKMIAEFHRRGWFVNVTLGRGDHD